MYPETESVLFFAGKQPIPGNPNIALWTYKIFFSKTDLGFYDRTTYRAPKRGATGNFVGWGFLLPSGYVPIGDIDPNYENQSLIPFTPSLLNQVMAEPAYECQMDDATPGNGIDPGQKRIWREVKANDAFFTTNPDSRGDSDVQQEPYALTFCFISSSMETIGACEILGPTGTGERPLQKFSRAGTGFQFVLPIPAAR